MINVKNKKEGKRKMIYTVTYNPSVDLFIKSQNLKPHIVNRTQGQSIAAKGGGINVSLALNNLGRKSIALGTSGGFVGNFIKGQLTEKNIPTHFVNVPGETRINVFADIISENQEYQLLDPGPKMPENSQKAMLDLLNKLAPNDIVVISGSFPKNISSGILVSLAKKIKKNKAQMVIDTSYSDIFEALKFHPFLLKPNADEIKKWFGIKQNIDENHLLKLGEKLVAKGAQKVLLSLEDKGAALIETNHIFLGNAPKVKTVHFAGAGDTMLASFVGGMETHLSDKKNLLRSIAAGSDTVRSINLSNFKHLDDLKKQIHIKSLKPAFLEANKVSEI